MAKSSKSSSGKRELIEPNNYKRYVKRNSKGEFMKATTRVNL